MAIIFLSIKQIFPRELNNGQSQFHTPTDKIINRKG